MRHAVVAGLLALVLAGGPAAAGQKDPRLDGLFDQLKQTQSDDEAREVEHSIWEIWTRNGDAEIDRLMGIGLLAMAVEDEPKALAAFTEVTQRDAAFAEGWNKRATVEFLMGDFTASVADIERTLALEPRHFGALSGLGQIYLALDRKPAALKAFEGALAIDPHLDSVKDEVEEIKKAITGSPT